MILVRLTLPFQTCVPVNRKGCYLPSLAVIATGNDPQGDLETSLIREIE